MLLLVLVGITITAAIPAVRIEPPSQEVISGDHFTITVVVENVTDMGGNQATVNFDPQAMSVVSVTEGGFLKGAGTTIGAGMEQVDNSNGSVTFFYALSTYGAKVSGSGVLATIEFATDPAREGWFGITLSNVLLSNGTGSLIGPIVLANGSVTLALASAPYFDTGSGTYPSIPGIHNGTITPSSTMTISKLYTYPCTGTGGHTESAAISYSNGTVLAEAQWTGYIGDWHNLSFNTTFTLYANVTYNYTLITGSYPQIIHAHSGAYEASGGKITCEEFRDANGISHENWIPAIRLLHNWG